MHRSESATPIASNEPALARGTVPRLAEGATVRDGGVEFTLTTFKATSVSLLLFDYERSAPARVIPLDPKLHRVGARWSVVVPNVSAGQLYAWRVDGPNDPADGLRFDMGVDLLDPYAKALTTNEPDAEQARSACGGENTFMPRCVVVDTRFDWQGVGKPGHRITDTIIYEMHVRGLTQHASSKVNAPGSYLGVIEKIPYLLDLGINAIELLPIHEFDFRENLRHNPLTNERLTNYWGYSTIGFFAPNGRYAHTTLRGGQVAEFQTMVRELHRVGIEVILDVVYNHTAEGNHQGPTINFKGIDNDVYYHLEPNKQYYKNYSGCGNTFNCQHPVAADMILASLRFWALEMGVDGFRFDLASILCRDRTGNIVSAPYLVEAIAEDPVLRDCKLIAEPWDAAGAYHVGSFPGGRWAEWNGRFRDDIRQFWRGDPAKTGLLATRLTGSSDLYQHSGRNPAASINFITSHDGFTLNDLVSFNGKHNDANGEQNRDGDNHNFSYNYGWEGPAPAPDVPEGRRVQSRRLERTRIRQIKNMLATLLLAQGVPMLVAGDEFRRTQRGNNNAYCQDNDISWLDWTFRETNREVYRFTRELIRFRKAHPVLRRDVFFRGDKPDGQPLADINWFSLQGEPKVWENDDHTLACIINGRAQRALGHKSDVDLLLLLNARVRPVAARLPIINAAGYRDRPWRRLFDTGISPPADLTPEGTGPLHNPGSPYYLVERSMACFYAPNT